MQHPDPATTKPDLRRHLRALLRSLTPDQRAERSQQACQRAAQHPLYTNASAVLTYLPAATHADPAEPAELDTTHLNHRAPDDRKLLAAPHIDWAARTMSPRLLTPDHPPAVRRFAIPEPPETAPRLPLDEIDLIILPGLAFDHARNRLGRGAGFYDRLLADARDLPNPPKTLALCFDIQILPNIPTDPHDQPADAVITESQTLDRPEPTNG